LFPINPGRQRLLIEPASESHSLQFKDSGKFEKYKGFERNKAFTSNKNTWTKKDFEHFRKKCTPASPKAKR